MENNFANSHLIIFLYYLAFSGEFIIRNIMENLMEIYIPENVKRKKELKDKVISQIGLSVLDLLWCPEENITIYNHFTTH